MNANNQPLARKKGTSTLVRAKFGPGMLLQHEDLEQLNIYARELNRLMFRSLFGCGVVCGLVVDPDVKCGKASVTVGSGLALDCQGDPIYVPQPQTIVVDEECNPDIPSPLWVVLCGTEKCCASRTATCSSDDDEAASVCTRERAGFEIRIMRARPQCTCSCKDYEANDVPMGVPDDDCWCANPEHPCYQDHYAGKCGCDREDCRNCDCVLLARLDRIGDDQKNSVWKADHRVRRFIRPMLMRDPRVQIEEDARKDQTRQLQQPSKQEVAQHKAEYLEAPAVAAERAPTDSETKSLRKPAPKRR